MLKLGSTTRESEEFTCNFHPVLMPLILCKLGVGNIVVPYLQQSSRLIQNYKKNSRPSMNLHELIVRTFSLLVGHSIGRLYPSGS